MRPPMEMLAWALMVLPLAVLASGQIVEVCRHSDLDFIRVLRVWSRWAENRTRGDARAVLTPLRAFNCPFCWSHWTSLLVMIPGGVAIFATGELGGIAMIVLMLPAVVRLSQLLNDFVHPWRRTHETKNVDLSTATPEQLEEAYVKLKRKEIQIGGNTASNE